VGKVGALLNKGTFSTNGFTMGKREGKTWPTGAQGGGRKGESSFWRLVWLS